MMKTISWDSIAKPEAESTRKTRAYLDARATAIGYIGVSRKTSGRVREKMRQAGVSDEVAAAVLADLIADGYINDYDCGWAILAARARKGVESTALLRVRLLRLGVAAAVAEALLAERPVRVDNEELVALLQDKFGKQMAAVGVWPPPERNKWTGRMARFLASRGFTGGEAAEAVYHVLDKYAGGVSDGD